MPVSKNRKNHKLKVIQRNRRIEEQSNRLRNAYLKKMKEELDKQALANEVDSQISSDSTFLETVNAEVNTPTLNAGEGDE